METERQPGPFVLPLADGHDVNLVGGKAINLARLINAGFPVPDGFVVTTRAFSRAGAAAGAMPPDVADAVRVAYRDIGSPTVAVRSSATAEDLADASMAGQYETYLDLQGEQAVLDAVEKCWRSVDSPRIRAYLGEHGIPFEKVAMAVVVQRLVPAAKAGVLFTANPRTGSLNEILIDANWGLGETVVSGLAQPDMLVLDRATGAVKSCVIADKQTWIEPGAHEARPLPDAKRKAGCLNSKDVLALWKLGLKVMDHFASPQDIEWAIADGRLYLLQSRTVTTLEDAETYEQLLSDVRVQLRAAGSAGRGGWVRHNIGETLPHPTPLTWSVIRRFMSGSGGFGQMYRQVGFEPSAVVSQDGFLDLIGGRAYMDLARGPGLFFEGFPYSYDLGLLRTNPDAAQGPPTVPSGTLPARLRVARRLRAANARLRALARDCDRRLTDEVIPRFVRYVADEKAVDISAMSASQWIDLWRKREQEVLDAFAPASLLASLVVAMAIEDLRGFLREQFWDEDPDMLANHLSAGGEPDLTVAANQGLFEIAAGGGGVEAWLARYGHRAPEEFDLASPRWREQQALVAKLAEHMKGASSPLALHEARRAETAARAAGLRSSLSPRRRDEFDRHMTLVHRYIRFREDGKHYLMLGYDLLRDMLLDAARRLDIGDGVFLLSIEELGDALTTGIAPLHLIEKRRELRMAEKRLSLPDVITEDDLATLGEGRPVKGGDRLDAFVLSGGHCRGPVRVVLTPQDAGELGKGYVLVCPSTDPSWTPLFVGASGVVLERGGMLSHGAVVAREMGIPAVVLPGATRLLAEEEIVTVDGHGGAVLRLPAQARSAPPPPSPNDTRVPPDMVPPVVGRPERRGAAVRNVFLAFWGLFFLAFLLEPRAMEAASFRALDAALLPLVAAAGKPVTVALIAAALALLTMLGQKLLTDNRRLLEAKRRASALQKQARRLPTGSPRHRALTSLAAPVRLRVAKAAFVPLAVLLGPMIVSFIWLPQRVDTAARNARPGSMVNITAVLDGNCDSHVCLSLDKPLGLDEQSPPRQSIFLAGPPLQRHLRKLTSNKSDLSNMPWDLALTVEHNRNAYIKELETFLAGKMPDQTLSWAVTTPKAQAGKWPMTLSVPGKQTVTVHAVLGEGYAPQPKEDLIVKTGKRQRTERQVQLWRAEDPNDPIKEVQVRYRDLNPVRGEGTFWKPLDWFEPDENTGPVKALFAPWLVLYVLVYVAVMFTVKAALRVA
jgi:pyruvate,water dikinase